MPVWVHSGLLKYIAGMRVLSIQIHGSPTIQEQPLHCQQVLFRACFQCEICNGSESERPVEQMRSPTWCVYAGSHSSIVYCRAYGRAYALEADRILSQGCACDQGRRERHRHIFLWVVLCCGVVECVMACVHGVWQKGVVVKRGCGKGGRVQGVGCSATTAFVINFAMWFLPFRWTYERWHHYVIFSAQMHQIYLKWMWLCLPRVLMIINHW